MPEMQKDRDRVKLSQANGRAFHEGDQDVRVDLVPVGFSPDLNPIEQVFAKLKHLLRKGAARTVDAVCAAIGDVLQAFTSEECANYLTSSGYRS
jgi:transposase